MPWGIFGQGLGAGSGDQESDKHVPPSRREPPDKAEKERLRKHYEDEVDKQTDEERGKAEPPKDGRLW